MDREKEVGQVKCTLCHANYTIKINQLDEPIDVYHAWIDECENVSCCSKLSPALSPG